MSRKKKGRRLTERIRRGKGDLKGGGLNGELGLRPGTPLGGLNDERKIGGGVLHQICRDLEVLCPLGKIYSPRTKKFFSDSGKKKGRFLEAKRDGGVVKEERASSIRTEKATRLNDGEMRREEPPLGKKDR